MPMKGPSTKEEFYAGYEKMRFGNRLRNWTTGAELAADLYDGPLRARSKVAAGVFIEALTKAEAVALDDTMMRCEPAPDELLILQGELCHGVGRGGYGLFCSTERVPMRRALASSGVQYYGLAALGRMQWACNAKSYGMVMDLLTEYPDAVIEFSAFTKCLGVLPGHNTVIWEVREY